MFLEKYKFPKLTQEKSKNLNRFSVFKISQKQVQIVSQVGFVKFQETGASCMFLNKGYHFPKSLSARRKKKPCKKTVSVT